MIRILFVCHGNICRSPMAEYVMKHELCKRGIADKFYVSSAATSSEEIGRGIHHGTVKILKSKDISYNSHKATRLVAGDADRYELFVGMDIANVRNMSIILGQGCQNKILRLLDYTSSPRDIADPWYTGDFETTYEDVVMGIESMLDSLIT